MREAAIKCRDCRDRLCPKTHSKTPRRLLLVPYIVRLVEISSHSEHTTSYVDAYIFTDNQAAIQAVDSPKSQSRQYIINEILNKIDRIQEIKPTCAIHIECVPGHKNVEGNERADQAAKAAATPCTTPPTIRMNRPKIDQCNPWQRPNGKPNGKRAKKMQDTCEP